VTKILIADDQADIRRLVEMVLRRGDRVILKVASGDEAVRLAGEHCPDLILMDIMMPGRYDGHDAIRILKGAPGTSRCRIIAMTADIRLEEGEKALSLGAERFIRKPFIIAELVEMVETLLADPVPGPGQLQA